MSQVVQSIKVQLLSYGQNRRDPGDLKALAESIKAKGVLVPLVVTKDPGSSGYDIRDGRRRFEAAKLAGVAEVPCLVSEEVDPDVDVILNTYRLQLSPVELYEQAKVSLETALQGKAETSPEAIQHVAKLLNLSLVEAQRILNVGRMAKEVLNLLASRKLPLGLALLTLRIPDAPKLKSYLAMVEKERPSTREAASWIVHTDLVTSLQGAPFDVETVCAKCPKRGQKDATLFEDAPAGTGDKEQCWDRKCYQEKQNAFLQSERAKMVKAGLTKCGIDTSGRLQGSNTPWKKVKPKDPDQCKVCAKVRIGLDRDWNTGINGWMAWCPSSCPNIGRTAGRSSSEDGGRSRGELKPAEKAKPVTERSRKAKIEYLEEKLALAARKHMIASFLTSEANDAKLRPDQHPKDHLRVLFHVGLVHHDNPFYHYDVTDSAEKALLASRDLQAVAFAKHNMEHLADYFRQLDRAGTKPADIAEEIESLYGVKGWCGARYPEIVDRLGADARKVLESIQPWAPDWAPKGAVIKPVAAAKPKPGVCRICGCTEANACMVNGEPCGWADRTKTLCDNPKCLAAAKKEKAAAKAKKKK